MQSSRVTLFTGTQNSVQLVDPLRRPESLVRAMNENFEHVCEIAGGNYLFVGEINSSYHLTINGFLFLDTNTIIRQFITTESPITVCDIGAGAFGFERNNVAMFGDEVRNVGISATSFGAVESPNRLIGYNAEFLSRIVGKNRFDLIFSRLTFVHFVDAIGSIIEAYKTLKPGGILIIDKFYIPGCNNCIPHLIPYLASQGYLVTGSAYMGVSNKLQCLIIKKTSDKPELLMPFHYGEFDEKSQRVSYLPSAQFKAYCISHNSRIYHDYHQGIELIKSLYMQGDIANIVNECRDINDLFNHPHYALLGKNDKFFTILLVVGKSSNSISSMMMHINQRAKESPHFEYIHGQLFESINPMEYYTGLCLLARDSSFSQLPLQDQQLIIEIQAMFNIIQFQHAHVIDAACERIGITLQKVKSETSYNGKDELMFSSFHRSVFRPR